MDQPTMMTAMQGAMAYQMLTLAADEQVDRVWPSAAAACLQRMIDDYLYRDMSMELWNEIFVKRNPELTHALHEMVGEAIKWIKPLPPRGA